MLPSDEIINADMNAFYDEMKRIQKATDEKNALELEFVMQNISYPVENILEMLEDGGGKWEHMGYCTMVKSDYKSGSYPSYDFYTEKDKSELQYMRQDDDGDFHNLVWQTTGIHGDDYSGYLLFPLTDGRYWKISYSC